MRWDNESRIPARTSDSHFKNAACWCNLMHFPEKIQPQKSLHTSRIHLDLLQLNGCTIAPLLLLPILPLLCFCAFVFLVRGHMTFGCGRFQRDQLELGKTFKQRWQCQSIFVTPLTYGYLQSFGHSNLLICCVFVFVSVPLKWVDMILVGNKAMFVRMSCHRDGRKCHMFTFSNVEQIPIHQASRCSG